MNKSSIITFLIVCVSAWFSGQSSLAAELRAAAGKADVTPDYSVDLWGYFDRSGPATGKRDPLMAKIVVLEAEPDRIATVTLDLGRTLNLELLNSIRDRVRKSADVDMVFFSASHTHSGPMILDSYKTGETPKWELAAVDKIAAAIEEAAKKLAPAKIGTGYGETLVGHNRRYIEDDGSVKMLWRNATKMPTSPVDPRVGVIRVDGADGKPIAILVNYSCHPVVFGPDNLEYSADYPGAMMTVVEEKFPGVVCSFLQGGAGDINPYFDKMALTENAVKLMQETGEQLGQEVVRVAETIKTEDSPSSNLKYSLDVMHFEMRWDVEKILPSLKAQYSPEMYERWKSYLTAPVECPVMSLVINDKISLMGMPGEPFVEFAIEFRNRSPYPESFFVGYANGYFGYFPTIRAAAQGGYGANGVVSRAEVGAGEAMLNHALVKMYELQGKLDRIPAP